jgi:SAM-dependent methyltransferase
MMTINQDKKPEKSGLPCPVCSADSRGVVQTGNGFSINRCLGCDLVFADPIPSMQALSDFYVGYEYAMPPSEDLPLQLRHVESGVDRIWERIKAFRNGRAPASILDFGGGLGFFAAALSDKCSDVSLFDLDPNSRRFALQTFGDKFKICDTPESALSRPGKYEFILLNQVIEHVREPVRFLEDVAKALAPDGILALTTPNNRTDDFYFRPDIFHHYLSIPKGGTFERLGLLVSDSWLCCDPPRHLFAFNEPSLRNAGRQAALAAVSIESAYFDDDPFGQPKYRFSGLANTRKTLLTGLYLLSKASGPMARMLDSQRQRGTTLIAYFKHAPTDAGGPQLNSQMDG